MLLTNVVSLLQDEADQLANLAAYNGIIGGFLYVVGTMAALIFIGAWLTSAKD
jgi:hypothetical protein